MRQRVRRAWTATPGVVRTPVAVLWRSIRLYIDDGCGTYAAAIAYYGIFSLVPLALISLSFVGLLVDTDRIVTWVFEQIPLRNDPEVQDNVNEIVRRAKDISLAGLGVGFVALVWSSSGVFAAVRRGLNVASHKHRRRPYWHGKLIDFALIPIAGLLILSSIGLTALVQQVVNRIAASGTFAAHGNTLVTVGSYLLPAIVSFGMFYMLYRFVPSARPRTPEAMMGAGFATVLFEVAKNLYAYLLVNMPFERDTAIYAGFGTAMAFLFWMFINGSILLLGAEFARATRMQLDAREAARAEREPVLDAPRIGGIDTSHRGL